MKKENIVAIENLSLLRKRVKDSQETAEEMEESIRKDAEGRKLKLSERIEIAEYSGTSTEACWNSHLISDLILKLVAE